MMMRLVTRWLELNNWLKLIVFFCLLGCVTNVVLISRDVASGGVLLRLHGGFLVLYAAQIAFIFLHERMVWVITALQGVLALLTSADFTFVPVVRMVGRFIYVLANPTPETLKIYKYVLISASFTLQMLSAYAEFSLLPAPKRPVEETLPTEELPADGE